MGPSLVERINFPYFLNSVGITNGVSSDGPKRIVVFFGCDFYNLPLDSNRQLFINKTNEMLGFIKKHFPGSRYDLLYQPHPNETDEYRHLELSDFIIGKHTVAELYLYQNADLIEYVFSAQSGASISAFSMGFKSAVFLDLLTDALSAETISAYRSYFFGLPDHFFIKSFDSAPIVDQASPLSQDKLNFSRILSAINTTGNIWFIAGDPAAGLRAAILAKNLRHSSPVSKMTLLVINHRRWDLGMDYIIKMGGFDEIIRLPGRRVWYGVNPKIILNATKNDRFIRLLPIAASDTIISFANPLFEENSLISHHNVTAKILFIDERWYKTIYDDSGLTKDPSFIKPPSWGVRFFNNFLEPVLGLNKTIYLEYQDGKVANVFKYRRPLGSIYDKVFLISSTLV